MKKHLFIIGLFFVLAISFVGCKKDDNASVSPRLEGRWNLKSFLIEEYKDGKLQPPKNNYSTSSAYLIFKGKKYELYDTDDELVETGTYTLVGNTLSIKSHDMTMSIKIKWNNADEFSYSNRYDVSISKNDYEIFTTTYVRHK